MQASLEDSERMGGGRMHRPPCRLPRLLSDEVGVGGRATFTYFPISLCVHGYVNVSVCLFCGAGW